MKELPIPSPFDVDALQHLRADLIERDSFYAGVVSTVLNDGRMADLGALQPQR